MEGTKKISKKKRIVKITYINGVNIREKPEIQSSILDVALCGEEFEISSIKNGYGKTVKGWINLDFTADVKKKSAD